MNATTTRRSGLFAASVKSLALALVVGATASHSEEDYSQWTGVRAYTINTSSAGASWNGGGAWSGNESNFPLLVRIADGDTVLTQAKAGGADLRFTKEDGTTRLHHEIEHWGEDGAVVWVLIDQVQANTAEQLFLMHWGKADAVDSSNGAAVFSPSNGYMGVWHMNGTGNETDATGNGNTAVASGGPGSVTGVIGPGRSLARASSHHFVVADDPSLNVVTNAFTLSAWVNAVDWDGSSRIFQKGQCTDGNACQYGIRENSSDRLAVEHNGTHYSGSGSANVPATGTWALVHGRFNGGQNRRVYLNGAQIYSVNTSTNTTDANSDPLYLGVRPDLTNFFNGIFDEMRVQSAQRSSLWIELEYQTQRPDQTVVQITDLPPPTALRERAVARHDFSAKAHGAGALFRIAESANATVTVTDVRGQVVWSGSFANGARELAWNGEGAANGLYVARLTVFDKQGRASFVDRRLTLAR